MGTVDPPPELDPSGPGPRAWRSRETTGALLDRWPFRRKINVLVIAPVVVVGVFLGVSVTSQVQQARTAARTAELVRDSGQVTRLINDVQAEYRQALLLSVQHESTSSGDTRPSNTAYRNAQQNTDETVAAVRTAFGPGLPKEEARALQYVRGLAVLRDKVERGSVTPADIDPAYAAAVDYLIDGIGLDRFSGTSSSEATQLLDTVLRADAAHASFESGVFSAQTRDANAISEYTRAVGAHSLYEHQQARFARIATRAQALRLGGIERHAEENGMEAKFAELQIDPGSLQGKSPRELREEIGAGTRQAQARLDITGSLIGQIAAQTDSLSDRALERALVLLGLALFGFASWVGFSVLVRRSVVRPLAALTRAAQQVVEVADEELARVEDEESADSTPLRPWPIPVRVRDEIGDLAQAFNQVQVTAAALLERQVLSRRNVAEMFGNVGRRVSGLTSRQLMLIDAVERGETDPDVLERLYRIDHIAVRLQRNAGSLMLLAGIRETEVEGRPVPLADVIRGGLGQIEGYNRVSLRSEADVIVAPDVIADLTLLLAELVENAVEFSPSHTPVEVVVRPGSDVASDDGVLIEVIDHGLGMSAERLDEENARLVRRERLDLVPTKVLGLFVVGSLARRWQIRAALSRTPGGGVTGSVWVPSALLLTESPPNSKPPTGTGGTAAGAAAGTVPELPTGSEQESGVPAPPPIPLPPSALPPGRTPATMPERHPVAPSPSTQGGLTRRVPAGEGAARAELPPAADETTAGNESRPLRRRVPGATLAMTTSRAERETSATHQPVDAEAVRSQLDEFEDAVRRAEQDSAATPTDSAPARRQQSWKEPGSDDAGE